MIDITQYHVPAPMLSRTYRLALVSDLHNCRWQQTADAIFSTQPDAVVIAGDLMENIGCGGDRALEFLDKVAAKFPVFYGLGNHEKFLGESDFSRIRETGAVLLVNASASFEELTIGAVGPELRGNSGEIADIHRSFLSAFEKEEGYRILLCHRPEWYFRAIRDLDIPLVLSGHAHGGQIRLFGRPIFSPGQGLFPKYAQGMHEGRLIVSRGLGNSPRIPRLFNRPEVAIITLEIPQ